MATPSPAWSQLSASSSGTKLASLSWSTAMPYTSSTRYTAPPTCRNERAHDQFRDSTSPATPNAMWTALCRMLTWNTSNSCEPDS